MNNWQKHWSNSSNDPRMQLLIGDMGPKGYGIYWLISERIHATGHDCALHKDIVRNIRSRRLNRQYIQQVIDKYYLFLMNTEGFVSHHPVPLGHMSAHLLHDLIHGKVQLPAETTASCSPNSGHPTASPEPTVSTKNGTNPHRLFSYYNTRASEKKKKEIVVLNNNHKNNAREGERKEEIVVSRFEEVVNGIRYVEGRPIPAEAPPRPSATALWDAGNHSWRDAYL